MKRGVLAVPNGLSAAAVLLAVAMPGCERQPSRASRAAIVEISPAVTFQKISGWEAAAQLGEVDCNPGAYRRYRDEVVDRAVNELGLTRLRLDLRSGLESDTDTWPAFLSRSLSYPQWRDTWFVPRNDNADPFDADPAGFQWGRFDHNVTEVVLPIRRALAARGERLYLNLNYIDFWLGAATKPFSHFSDPEEYAELLLVVFEHMRGKYGFVPDGVEVLLEPENTPHGAREIGRAIVALEERLTRAGYHPDIIAPSTTRMANAPAYYDEMLTVPGIAGRIDELSYHRYTGISRPTLAAISNRASRDGITTGMLEHLGSGFAELYDDLTIGNVSAWQQFTIAYCGRRDNPDATGSYLQVNQSDSLAPRVHLTRMSRLFRQVFNYVRPGAIRVAATSTEPSLRPLAFRNADGRLVLVGWTEEASTFSVRGLPAGRYGINYSTTHGRYNAELSEVTVTDNGAIAVPMPAAGVVTVYGK